MAQEIRCHGCGQDAPLDSRFCPHCGCALSAAPAGPPAGPAGGGFHSGGAAWYPLSEPPRPPLPFVRPATWIAWLLVISSLATFVLAVIGFNPATKEALPFAILSGLTAAICSWVLLYKAWACVQDGHARTSPEAALGRMFIPIFNIYWIFIAVGSWANAYNTFADRNGIGGFRATPIVFQVFAACSLLPFVGLLSIFLFPFVVYQWCRAINTVARAHRAALPPARAIAAPPLSLATW